jgi:hypothetical protein
MMVIMMVTMMMIMIMMVAVSWSAAYGRLGELTMFRQGVESSSSWDLGPRSTH